MHLLDAGTQRLDIARCVQLRRGLAYESKAVAAKSYSDATLGTASFIHQETSDLPTLFTTIKFCEFCNKKGHDIVECHNRITSGNPQRKYINLKKKGDEKKEQQKRNNTDGKYCTICRKPGHSIEECFFNESTYNGPHKQKT